MHRRDDRHAMASAVSQRFRYGSGGCGQEAWHRCRPHTLSLADMNKLFSLGVPRKTVQAITVETGEPASAWMKQHSLWDGLSMNEGVLTTTLLRRTWLQLRTRPPRTGGPEDQSPVSHERKDWGDSVLSKDAEEKTAQPHSIDDRPRAAGKFTL